MLLGCRPAAKSSRWSFGGNRLQIKAEIQLLADVEAALRAVSVLSAKTSGKLQSLAVKHDLLQLLLDDEQTRLIVWLYPLDHERRRIFSSGHNGRIPSDVSQVHSTQSLSLMPKYQGCPFIGFDNCLA